MSEYIPQCLACEGPIKSAEERISVSTGRGKSAVRYRHASDTDCARYLRTSGYTGDGFTPKIDEPDYTENGPARDRLTARHLRKGGTY